MSKTIAPIQQEVAWYEVSAADYYGEYCELVPAGFEGRWPKQFPKLDPAGLFTEKGAQLFVEWPKKTVLETVVAVRGETSINVDMVAAPDIVKTQKFFVQATRYGHKFMVSLPKGIRLRVG